MVEEWQGELIPSIMTSRLSGLSTLKLQKKQKQTGLICVKSTKSFTHLL